MKKLALFLDKWKFWGSVSVGLFDLFCFFVVLPFNRNLGILFLASALSMSVGALCFWLQDKS
jgi:hypothetical protein